MLLFEAFDEKLSLSLVITVPVLLISDFLLENLLVSLNCSLAVRLFGSFLSYLNVYLRSVAKLELNLFLIDVDLFEE